MKPFSPGLVLALFAAAQQNAPQLTLTQQLYGPYSLRIRALTTLLSSKDLLANPQTRRAVIRLLNHDTNDPKSQAFAESVQWEEYYGDLAMVVQKIATEYHDPTAWKALVTAAYNEDSDFAQWIASQPEALPALLDTARHDTNSTVRGNAIYVLATALARCRPLARDKSCLDFEAAQAQILTLIRDKALHDTTPARLAAVRALGLCGDEKDISLLNESQSPERDESSVQIWASFVHQAQREIEARLKK